MKKYIKLNGEQILEVRPLLEEGTDQETIDMFEKEFITLDVPDDIKDLDLLIKYKYVNGKFVESNEILLKKQYNLELIEINQWFINNDWKVNKVFIGEWEETDPRWINYLSERADKRERQDELKALLSE